MTGVWIGQTLNETSALHLWLFVQNGEKLTIYTSWLGLDEQQGLYEGLVAEKVSQFILFANERLLIPVYRGNFFTAPDWAMGAKGEEMVPRYDVMFQKCDRGVVGYLTYLYITLFSWSPFMLRQLI